MTDNQSGTRKFGFRNISWLTYILAFLAIITFLVIVNSEQRYYPMPLWMGGGVAEDSRVMPPSQGSAPGKAAPEIYPYPYPAPVPGTDTREFLKIYYNAAMRTRDVPGLTRRVETTVRGHNGRIDQESVTSEYGYVSFAVPKSKFEVFRNELEGFVGNRFLKVSISSQNLLPQKVSIEEQLKQADKALADYKAARQKIVTSHAGAVQSLQAKISAAEQEIATLRAQPQTPEVLAEIQTVSAELTSLKQQLANENASYATQLNNADANIKYAQDWQKAVQTQDKALLDNIATVNGTVTVQWISYWDMARLYLPGYWIPFIFAVLAFLSYLYDRRRFEGR